ncbi:MAG: hypothetical protein HC849_21555 [Oscillatoriales cyanobacterium RU_3_3]|nr:hypothetical protein [Oscillatoriales cyanobacterium RU_3_3]NJR21641.1 hypothetical protein [Richelia sp. CSU_2_1]
MLILIELNVLFLWQLFEGRRKKEEGRRKKEEGLTGSQAVPGKPCLEALPRL